MSCGNTVHLPAPGQLVMLPANYLTTAKVAIPPNVKPKPAVLEPTANTISEVNMESNGIRPRKPCNCTKSQCLKLYCDCFANGEFCNMCNCMNCFNNLENEEHRQRAIKSCLERNPSAFRPKIGKAKDMGDASIRKHTKGCNCKRSGCLKNYCECYEVSCSIFFCRHYQGYHFRPKLRVLIIANVLVVEMLKIQLMKRKCKPLQMFHFPRTHRCLQKWACHGIFKNYVRNDILTASTLYPVVFL